MEKLKFRDFVWPQNPTEYRQQYLQKPVYEKNAAGETEFQGLSPLKRTITGSGVFSGGAAYDSFQALAALCGLTEPGTLVHPVWGSVSAYLTELNMEQSARGEYVEYSFTFQVADDQGAIPQ